jgi:hypothetical protein
MTIREQITACNNEFALTLLHKKLELLNNAFQDGNINYVDFKILELGIINDIKALELTEADYWYGDESDNFLQ